MFGNHGLCGLLEEGTHEKSPKCLSGNLGDFGEFCKGLGLKFDVLWIVSITKYAQQNSKIQTQKNLLFSKQVFYIWWVVSDSNARPTD